MVRLDSEKHINFSYASPFGSVRPSRVARKNARKHSGSTEKEEE